jgi:hypothetical protein
MTPKEKAQELVSKFKELPQEGTLMFYLAFEISKQCALIAQKNLLEKLQSLNITDEFEENVLLEINVL